MTARVQARRLVLEKEKIIESELKGLTLRVYWHILGSHKKDSIGVRAVQRALGLSSPSVSLHHLEKLRSLGLLEKDFTGEYRLVNEVRVGVLRNFVGLFGLLLPRYLFYSTMFTAMLLLYPVLFPPTLSPHNTMAFVFGVLGAAVSWTETIRVWRMRPF
jgi:DNA-binding transcriptional ArsR family regulator